MKHYYTPFCTLTLIFLSFKLFGQNKTGNEWIDFGQTYFKIEVAQTGFYEIGAMQLQNAGIPVDNIHIDAYQIFRLGEEIPIEVEARGKNMLDESGAIRFYATRNDGRSETSLYVRPEAMPHSYYSLYSDTAAYFLTWKKSGVSTRRIAVSPPRPATDTVSFHFGTHLQVYNSHYRPGRFYPENSDANTGSAQTAYDVGEGWTGREIKENEHFEIDVPVENQLTSQSVKADFEMLLTGWSAGKHIYEVWITGNPVSRKLGEISFEDFSTTQFFSELTTTELSGLKKCTIVLKPVGRGGHISVSYAKLQYPQDSRIMHISNQEMFHFQTSPNAFWQLPTANAATFYDCSNLSEIKKLHDADGGLSLAGATAICGVTVYMKISQLKPIQWTKFNPDETEYLIISNPLMHLPAREIDPVKAYAAYRSSEQGGRFKTTVIPIQGVYDTFNYGQRSPQAIRNAIHYFKNKGSLQFVLLLGKSVDPQKVRKIQSPGDYDMIPNAGWPGSDIALSMPPGGHLPAVPVGRVNANLSFQILDYLEKVKTYEMQSKNAFWRKKVLHLSGGRTRDELMLFKSYVRSFEEKIRHSHLGASVETVSKISDAPVEKLDIHQKINAGVAVVTLFGHSGIETTDIILGQAADTSTYHNAPKYPLIIVNGCASGSIFFSAQALANEWILAPKSGAVLFLAHTSNGVSSALKKYTDMLYEVISDKKFGNLAFGLIQQEAIRRSMKRVPTIYDSIAVQQMNLHGDPAVKIFPALLPDFSIDSADVSTDQAQESDSIDARIIIRNLGRYRSGQYAIVVKRRANSKTVDSVTYLRPTFPVSDTIYFSAKNFSKNEKWYIQIDPEQKFEEESETNNDILITPATIRKHRSEERPQPPLMLITFDGKTLANTDFTSAQPLISIQIFSSTIKIPADTSGLVIWLKNLCEGCVQERLFLNNATVRTLSDQSIVITFRPARKLKKGTNELNAAFYVGQSESHYSIRFMVAPEKRITSCNIFPNPASEEIRFQVTFSNSADYETVILSVFDISGNLVHTADLHAVTGINEWIWVPENLSSGLYFYALRPKNEQIEIAPEAESRMKGKLIIRH